MEGKLRETHLGRPTKGKLKGREGGQGGGCLYFMPGPILLPLPLGRRGGGVEEQRSWLSAHDKSWCDWGRGGVLSRHAERGSNSKKLVSAAILDRERTPHNSPQSGTVDGAPL